MSPSPEPTSPKGAGGEERKNLSTDTGGGTRRWTIWRVVMRREDGSSMVGGWNAEEGHTAADANPQHVEAYEVVEAEGEGDRERQALIDGLVKAGLALAAKDRELERLREALSFARAAIPQEHPEPCGTDACWLCAAETTIDEALAAGPPGGEGGTR